VPSNAVDAVVFLQGGGGTKEGFAHALGLNVDAGPSRELSPEGRAWLLARRIVAVFPQGQYVGQSSSGKTWSNHLMISGVDDVFFLQDLAAALRADTPLPHLERLFLAGHSNGGVMANRMWCESSATFDAYGSLAGPPAPALHPVTGSHRCRPLGDPVDGLVHQRGEPALAVPPMPCASVRTSDTSGVRTHARPEHRSRRDLRPDHAAHAPPASPGPALALAPTRRGATPGRGRAAGVLPRRSVHGARPVGYARGVARAEDRYCPACRRSVEGPWCPDDGVATLRLGGPQVESSALVPGTLIAGRYRVEARLGDGGFGTVFRARHLGTGQPMALKVLRTEPEDRDTLLPRFFQEARITAGLTHPNTVRVFDFGQDERGVVFLAMELVAGKTLTHELGDRARQGQRFAEAEAAWVVSEVLASLAEAHALGLVHRDLKPDNVMLYGVPGDELARVKVLDFGIVKARNASLTVAGAAPFTPAFASPEQVSGGALDGRSDLYSLGALLFLLLTGEPPFRASTPLELMYMHVVQPAPSLLERPGLGISAAMAGLVARALAKDPDERFADAHTMREALLRCVERHLLEAPHAPTRPRAPALDETDEAPLPAHLRADTDAGASSERARPSGAAATPRVDDTPPMVQAAPRGGDTSPIESITEPPIEDTAPGWTARGGA
jgi:serine/threonine protein kinase/predicted esterase